MEKLSVRNFGPIRDVEIELKDLTIFIGETGTGKSTLAKLIAIFRDVKFWKGLVDNESNKEKYFKHWLNYYQIANTFLKESTDIVYTVNTRFFPIEFEFHGGFIVENFVAQFNESIKAITSKRIDTVVPILDIDNKSEIFYSGDNKEQEDDNSNLVLSAIFRSTAKDSIYFPADRGIVSSLSDNYPNFERKKLLGLFPQTLLDFTGYFSAASSFLRELYIELFEVKFYKEKESGKSYILLPTGEESLLSDTASGMQTLIPVLVILEHFANSDSRKSYIFEEPELNLFPLTQKKLVELLAAKALGNGHKLVITTHSPYILTALNNLLYAYQVGQLSYDKTTDIVNTDFWIAPQSTVAYMVNTGSVYSILDDELHQVKAEEIDGVSEILNSAYTDLSEIEAHEKYNETV
jgi:predicted ATPase